MMSFKLLCCPASILQSCAVISRHRLAAHFISTRTLFSTVRHGMWSRHPAKGAGWTNTADHLTVSQCYGAVRWFTAASVTSNDVMNVFDRNTKRKQRNRTASLPDYNVYDYLKDEVTVALSSSVVLNNADSLNDMDECRRQPIRGAHSPHLLIKQWRCGMTNYHIGPHRTLSECKEPQNHMHVRSHHEGLNCLMHCNAKVLLFCWISHLWQVDVDVEIRQAQAKPLSLLFTYTFLIRVAKFPIKLTSAPGSVQFRSVVIHKFLVLPKFI